MGTDFYIEVSYAQRYYHDQRICGDVFLSERLKDENRVIAVLSDGHGTWRKSECFRNAYSQKWP